MTLGEAHHVEPVTGVALAVGGGGEETIDESLVGVGPGVGEEGVDLGWRRREAGQVEGDAAEERGAIRFGGESQALLLEGREEERIDRRSRRAAHQGDVRPADRSERPPVRPRALFGDDGDGSKGGAIPGGPGVDPSPQRLGVARRERRPGRHLAVADVDEQRARRRLVRHQGGAMRAAREEAGPTREVEVGARLRPGVALQAVRPQQRRDLARKRGRGEGRGRRRREEE